MNRTWEGVSVTCLSRVVDVDTVVTDTPVGFHVSKDRSYNAEELVLEAGVVLVEDELLSSALDELLDTNHEPTNVNSVERAVDGVHRLVTPNLHAVNGESLNRVDVSVIEGVLVANLGLHGCPYAVHITTVDTSRCEPRVRGVVGVSEIPDNVLSNREVNVEVLVSIVELDPWPVGCSV